MTQSTRGAIKAALHKLIDVNVKSAFFGSQAAVRAMVLRVRGVILNTCLIAGLCGTGDLRVPK